ncbi:MEDS domain-containing protein [Nonomuraea sp. NPDC049607]|uniref:MEDS domain-containing protein n=1 Tax=Nonomuraea sp. NPDC049607 TaxID=3154732 RepID=UPI003434898F
MAILPPVHTGDHLGARFGSDDAFLSAAAEFAHVGVTGGAQVMIFPSPRLRGSLGDRLGASPPLRRALHEGHLHVMDTVQARHAGGGFDAGRLHAAYRDAALAATAAGYPGLWVAVDMAWACPVDRADAVDAVDIDALVAFEAAANTLFTLGTLTALCAYDTRVFTSGHVFRACQAHPAIAEAARFGHRATADGDGLAFSGEADRSNALAWNALLSSFDPGHHVVDISAMSFLGVRALADLADLAAADRSRPLTIRATSSQVTRLSLLRIDRLAAIEVLPARTP